MVLGAFLPIILWAPMDQFVKSMLIGSGIIVLFGLVDDTLNTLDSSQNF